PHYPKPPSFPTRRSSDLRHNLPEINIMNDDATINSLGGKYAGMDRYEARKAMVEDLKEQGLLVKVVPHSHSVGTHDRCGTTVERSEEHTSELQSRFDLVC